MLFSHFLSRAASNAVRTLLPLHLQNRSRVRQFRPSGFFFSPPRGEELELFFVFFFFLFFFCCFLFFFFYLFEGGAAKARHPGIFSLSPRRAR